MGYLSDCSMLFLDSVPGMVEFLMSQPTILWSSLALAGPQEDLVLASDMSQNRTQRMDAFFRLVRYTSSDLNLYRGGPERTGQYGPAMGGHSGAGPV